MKQDEIDEMRKQLEWYRMVVKHIADFKLYQGKEHQESNNTAGHRAWWICNEAISGKSWKEGVADYRDFTDYVGSERRTEEPTEAPESMIYRITR